MPKTGKNDTERQTKIVFDGDFLVGARLYAPYVFFEPICVYWEHYTLNFSNLHDKPINIYPFLCMPEIYQLINSGTKHLPLNTNTLFIR